MRARAPLSSLIFFCFFSLSAAAGDGTLRGKVTDMSGAAVAGAFVLIEPGGSRAVSDSIGDFSVTLPAGRYRLTARAEHFQDVSMTLDLPAAAAQPIEIAFAQLRPSRTQIDVIGEYRDVLSDVPGSAAIVTRDQLEARRPVDTAEVLRTVPGLHVVEDSGPVSMRLNLGIRGLNPDRSRQVLVLEDGLPLALAPYGEPEMYYSPPIDRMRRIEVLKGSGSILYGPQTIGGVVNFVTPDPPPDEELSVQLTGGNNSFLIGQASWGDTFGDTGVLVNVLHKQGAGFRNLNFDIDDLTTKVKVGLTATQSLSFKLNVYDERSNSTYLGLTVPQFQANPNQNAVSGDRLNVRRFFGSAHHQVAFGSRWLLNTTLFGTNTSRNWRRQDFDRSANPSRTYLGVAGDPRLKGGAIFLRDSTGNRNRQFDVWGIESRALADYRWLGFRNKLELGARYLFERAHEQRIDGATAQASQGILSEDEFRTGHAVSLFSQNKLFLSDRLSLTPGVRIERFNYERHILRKKVNGVPADVNFRSVDNLTKAIPGIGLNFEPARDWTLFGGIHRGFAPPRVKDALDSSGGTLQLDAELSWNLEAGARWSRKDFARAEATLFVLDFENQIIPASQSSGQASFGLTNGGETLHRGLEVAGTFDAARWRGHNTSFALEGHYTYLPTARFTGGFIPLVKGKRLPYAPRHLLGFSAAFRGPRGWGASVDGSYIGAQFTDPANTLDPTRGPNPRFDGLVGRLPSYTIWNATVDYTVRADRATIVPFVSVKNLSGRTYIISRAPEGIQPGWPRQLLAGIRLQF
ncbi:MAG: TonB-dependent receptor domain-containing protein [Acidobacteriota bacterium]